MLITSLSVSPQPVIPGSSSAATSHTRWAHLSASFSAEISHGNFSSQEWESRPAAPSPPVQLTAGISPGIRPLPARLRLCSVPCACPNARTSFPPGLPSLVPSYLTRAHTSLPPSPQLAAPYERTERSLSLLSPLPRVQEQPRTACGRGLRGHPPPGLRCPPGQRRGGSGPSARLTPARQRQPLPTPRRGPRAEPGGTPRALRSPRLGSPALTGEHGGRGRQGAAPRAPPAGPPLPARRKPQPPRSVTSAGQGRGLRAAPPPRAAGGGDGGTSGVGKRERAWGFHSAPSRAGDARRPRRCRSSMGCPPSPHRARRAPACPAPPRVPACRAARHWGKGRGAEGAVLARWGRCAPVLFCAPHRPWPWRNSRNPSAPWRTSSPAASGACAWCSWGTRWTPSRWDGAEPPGRAAGRGGGVAERTTFPSGRRAGAAARWRGRTTLPDGSCGAAEDYDSRRASRRGCAGPERPLPAWRPRSRSAQRALPKCGVNSGALALILFCGE